MQLPTSPVVWESIRQALLAVVFFGFVLFAYKNGMSNSDIAMWIALAGTSLGISIVKSKSEKPAVEESPKK